MDSFPKSGIILVKYDRELAKITGRREEESMINEGQPFLLFLHFFLTTYPEIKKKYPPGELAFFLNGRPPADFETLSDGDVILFAAK